MPTNVMGSTSWFQSGANWIPSTARCRKMGTPFWPFTSFVGWEGSPTKRDVPKKVGTLILTSLLEDLVDDSAWDVESGSNGKPFPRKRVRRKHVPKEHVPQKCGSKIIVVSQNVFPTCVPHCPQTKCSQQNVPNMCSPKN